MVIFPIILFALVFSLIGGSPQRGVLVFSFFIAFWFEWDIEIKIGLIDTIVVLVLFDHFFLRKENKAGTRVKVPYLLPFFAFTFFAILPFIIEGEEIKKALWASYKIISFNLIYLVVFLSIQNKDDITKLVRLSILSTSIASIIAILQTFTRNPIDFLAVGTYAADIKRNADFWLPRAWGTLRSPNSFSGFLIWPMSISLGIFITSQDRKEKRYLLISILIQALALMCTQSRAGTLGLMMSFCIICVLFRYRKAILIAFLGMAILFLLRAGLSGIDLVPGDISSRLLSIVKEGAEEDAMKARYVRWEFYFDIIKKNPWGEKKVITPMEFEMAGIEYAQSPHSTYMHLALNSGIFGLMFALLILLGMLKTAYRLSKESGDVSIKGLSGGVFAGGIGFMFHGFFEVLWSNWQTGMLIWFLLGLVMAIHAKDLKNFEGA